LLQIVSAVSKSKKKAAQRILDANTVKCDNTDENPRDSVAKEVEFITQEEQRKIFSDFLIKRRRDKQRTYKWKQLDKQKRLNNFEEEIDEEFDYEDNIDDDIDNEYIDDFEDEMKK